MYPYIPTVMSSFPHLVVVVEQSQCCCTVFISINAHHGLSGSGQWVLQVAPPRLILAADRSTRGHQPFIWYHDHQPFTERTTGQWKRHNKPRRYSKTHLSLTEATSAKPPSLPQAVSHQTSMDLPAPCDVCLRKFTSVCHI